MQHGTVDDFVDSVEVRDIAQASMALVVPAKMLQFECHQTQSVTHGCGCFDMGKPVIHQSVLADGDYFCMF